MFGNKKNTLPPRPKIPEVKKIVEDLNCASDNDVAFKLLARENQFNDTSTNSNVNRANIDCCIVYDQIKTYLETNKELDILKKTIVENKDKLDHCVNNMIELTDKIKEQAQEALI